MRRGMLRIKATKMEMNFNWKMIVRQIAPSQTIMDYSYLLLWWHGICYVSTYDTVYMHCRACENVKCDEINAVDINDVYKNNGEK